MTTQPESHRETAMTNLKTFADLEHLPHPNHGNGTQARMDFENGYGVSVIRSSYSYGGDRGLYEMAVMRDGDIDYSTPVTDDVLGHLSEAEVTEHMAAVQTLPRKETSA